MNLSNLKPAEYNPRSIDQQSFDGLKYSLSEFGDLACLVYNLETGNLVCGHQRSNGLISSKSEILEIMFAEDSDV